VSVAGAVTTSAVWRPGSLGALAVSGAAVLAVSDTDAVLVRLEVVNGWAAPRWRVRDGGLRRRWRVRRRCCGPNRPGQSRACGYRRKVAATAISTRSNPHGSFEQSHIAPLWANCSVMEQWLVTFVPPFVRRHERVGLAGIQARSIERRIMGSKGCCFWHACTQRFILERYMCHAAAASGTRVNSRQTDRQHPFFY